MSTTVGAELTLADLARYEGKAELVAGRIVPLMPTGRRPSRVASRIFRSLDDLAAAVGRGEAYADNTGFAVGRLSSGRQSFSPDASYFTGPFPDDPMQFDDFALPDPGLGDMRTADNRPRKATPKPRARSGGARETWCL